MKAKKHKVSALSPDQLRGVLEIAAAKSPRDHAMLLVQYFHGLRASELVNLKLSDLDRRQRVWAVKVERLKGSLETRQSVWEVKGKPLWNERKVLADYLENHRPKDAPTDVVFVSSKRDGPLCREAWNRIFKAYAKEAGLPANLQHSNEERLPHSDELLPLEELERRAILRALREAGGDKLAAARLLGIGKTTLYRKLKQYDAQAQASIS